MAKTLKHIIKNTYAVLISGSLDTKISGISFDSRRTEKGDLFVAVKGTNSDGHLFIEKAVKNGAVAVLAEHTENIDYTVTILQSQNTSKALAHIASEFYDNPSEKIKLVGIIGTNGKTTTATLLYHYFRNAGYKVGLISTVKNYINETEIDANYTTPDAVTFNKLLKQMTNAGCEYCFAEISSHAIHQNRTAALQFTGGIFTNITHDHLDYHKTFAEYLKVKKKFFDNLPESAFSLVNIDDKNGNVMLQNTKSEKHTYALKSFADFKGKILELHFDGTFMSINETELWTLLIGKFNAYNITAVYASAVLLNQNPENVLRILSNLKPVKGRFETVKINNITAIIDYAHTPDALDNVLKTINEIKKENQNLITIAGAGGNRDKTKRPLMAKIAMAGSNKLILTSDNPRDENPEQIIKDMLDGIEKTDRKNVLKITDRKEAIKVASALAQQNDIILIAGKGHEDYQIIKGEKYHFDDKEIITEILNDL
ncbi:MAG: UDP-N-acetylmuramoyl-L-alanyl-D-glutamate--2,6-diaminopimelate ligase [Chlorobi bacterium]|nr:UDP-N-acetylmuramoyl-L-alanyl-D-glutamate--2,6-diaminopimelate ligase [Chlorobiota bacterium]